MMNDYQSEPHDDLSDDADLLRSLQPRKPELNWQAILAELPMESSEKVSPVQTNFVHKLATSWWSGALAGSLITLAIVSWIESKNAGHFISGVDHQTKSNPREIERDENYPGKNQQGENHQVASQDQRSATKPAQPATAELSNSRSPIANNSDSKADSLASEPVSENQVNDPIDVYMLRHGLDSRLVSRSTASYSLPESRLHDSETSSEPPTQSALRKMLLDFQ